MDIHGVVAIATRVHDAEGYNIGSASTREYRNRFWARVVGIAHHGHPVYNPTPDPQWHLKDGGGGRPQSDDVAVSMPSRQFWDCIPQAGGDGYRFEASGEQGPLPPEQNVYPPPVPAGGGVVTPPVVSNVWTPAHEVLRLGMFGRSAREIAEQLAFTFPAEHWGEKRTQTGTASPDTIGRLVEGRLYGVRVMNGVKEWGFLDDQVHLPVAPVNHLGVPPVVAPPVEPPPVVVPPAVPSDLEARLTAIEQALAGLATKADITSLGVVVSSLRQDVLDTVRGQSYDIDASAGYFGRVRGTITPKP